MPRKLIICIDGTGNQISDQQTNVLKLYRCLRVNSDTQKVLYVPGVGTNSSQSVIGKWTQKLKGLQGLAFGLGLEDDVLTAYRFLCAQYQEDDQILIFGFSRGAYGARVLAGFMNNFGLLPESQLHLAPRAFRAYRKITDADASDSVDKTYQNLREYEQVLHVRHVPIRFLGLFDTVSSIVRFRRMWHNLTNHGSLLEMGTHASVDENPSVEMVRHALAIDERRSMFRAQHWRPSAYYGNRFKRGDPKRQDVEQMWFPGYHSDVGGSPYEDRSGIGKISLLWMIDALTEAGVELDFVGRRVEKYLKGADETKRTPGGRRYAEPNPLAPIHDSMIPAWKIFEWLPKSRTRREPPRKDKGFIWYLPRHEPRNIPIEPYVTAEGESYVHTISDAARTRRDAGDYDPPNLPT